jgi:hypothetical protein
MFWQNVSTAVGCDGGHLDCMRSVDFTTLQDAASTVTSDYIYQFQPRVDGDIVADTCMLRIFLVSHCSLTGSNRRSPTIPRTVQLHRANGHYP